MDTKQLIQKVKKNEGLNRSEKKELIDFWSEYVCPIDGTRKVKATYFDGDIRIYTVAKKLEDFYDETPAFIKEFFRAMSAGEKFRTRFAIYEALPVS